MRDMKKTPLGRRAARLYGRVVMALVSPLVPLFASLFCGFGKTISFWPGSSLFSCGSRPKLAGETTTEFLPSCLGLRLGRISSLFPPRERKRGGDVCSFAGAGVLIDLAQRGIDANPVACITWAQEAFNRKG